MGLTITVTNSTVIDNFAREAGGGFNNTYGKTTLTNCTVSGNSAGPFYAFGAGGACSTRAARIR